MKYILELGLLFLALSILYVRPNALMSFYNNVLGKVVIVSAIVLLTHRSTEAGLLGVLFVVAISQTLYEGMANGKAKLLPLKKIEADAKEDTKEISAKEKFKKEHCFDGELKKDKDGKVITSYSTPDFKKTFPSLKFADKECNPCDAKCDFEIEITTADEQISVEENLRAKPSNQDDGKLAKTNGEE